MIKMTVKVLRGGGGFFLRSFLFWLHFVENLISFPIMYNMMGFFHRGVRFFGDNKPISDRGWGCHKTLIVCLSLLGGYCHLKDPGGYCPPFSPRRVLHMKGVFPCDKWSPAASNMFVQSADLINHWKLHLGQVTRPAFDSGSPLCQQRDQFL